jgi:hypothetical protein
LRVWKAAATRLAQQAPAIVLVGRMLAPRTRRKTIDGGPLSLFGKSVFVAGQSRRQPRPPGSQAPPGEYYKSTPLLCIIV